MPFKITQFEDILLDQLFIKAFKELEDFFHYRWEKNIPRLLVVEDRETINALYGKITENWLVSWADNTRNIYILSRENYEKYSNYSYSDDEFYRLIKHELSHAFYKLITYTDKPRWLNEGISVYVGGQIEQIKKPNEFKNFLSYFDRTDSELYKEAGFLVKLLLTNFGAEKLLIFIKSMKSIKSPEDVDKLFTTVFGIQLNYTDLNKLLVKM